MEAEEGMKERNREKERGAWISLRAMENFHRARKRKKQGERERGEEENMRERAGERLHERCFT